MEIWVAKETKRVNDLYVPYFNPKRNIDAQLLGEVSVTSPVLDLVNYHDYFDYNMVCIPLWDYRYYFIDDVVVDGNHTYLHCSEDYLASWYNELIVSTYYCVRSYSSPNSEIIDTLFPVQTPASMYSLNMPTPWERMDNGQYVVAISSGGNGNPHIGTNSYYVLKQSEMTAFMDDLMGKADLSFSGIADSIAKAIVNPMQYIRSCTWFPCEITGNMTSVDHIDFGWWSADASAKVLNVSLASDTYTEIKLTFDYDAGFFAHDDYEYQAFPPYSRYTITCYPFGIIELPTSVISRYIRQQYPIILDIFVDSITGMATLLLLSGEAVCPFYITTAQVGVSIPVGQVLQDFAGAVTNVAGAAGQLFSGHIVGAASGVYSMLDSLTPQVTVSGASGGFAQLMLYSSWCLKREYWQANVQKDFKGLPCCLNKVVGGLRGYAKFEDVDVEGEMYDTEKRGIKQLLESGIFIARESEWNSTNQLKAVKKGE